MENRIIHGALFGVAVGDALGVPVEFRSRDYLKTEPVTDMQAYGTHHQPAGTWSDDSSLTFCLAEMLVGNYNLNKLSTHFINWFDYAFWTPYGEVFDIGITTSQAIHRLKQGVSPTMAGGENERENGNGSLMRILPLAFYVKNMTTEKRFDHIKEVSSLTHRHIRSILACYIYIEFALRLIEGEDKFKAYLQTKDIVNHFIIYNPICSTEEIEKYNRILTKSIQEYTEEETSSTGYVVHSLEAALWCILHENSFESTVLKAVNLGSDTDTTAAITGGLAGLIYGYESIPKKWIEQLARKEDILKLCDKLEKKYYIETI